MESTNQYSRKKMRFIIFPIILAAGLFAISGVVMWLWNAILPSVITGVTTLTYWQAMGILVLSKILFAGFRFGGHRKTHQHFAQNGFKSKFMEMSDEEKQQFKSQWKKRCC